MNSKVSIIMPAYNSEHTLQEAIESILTQTFREWELLIINDYSSDGTKQLVESFIQIDPRIKLFNLPENGGLSNARNYGILQASGNYIAFLDSDDKWFPEKLLLQIDFHNRYPHVLISHTDFEMFNHLGPLNRPWSKFSNWCQKKEGNLLPTLYYKNVIGILTIMVEKKLLLEVGGFDTTLWTLEDQDLWIRIAEKGYAFGFINKILASYRISPGSMSRTTGKYKKAYKAFFKKHLCKFKKNSFTYKLAFVHYYRIFGIAYYKKRQYQLANLFFFKSISILQLDLSAIPTILYIQLNLLKQVKTILTGK